jgi:hypothetical protein
VKDAEALLVSYAGMVPEGLSTRSPQEGDSAPTRLCTSRFTPTLTAVLSSMSSARQEMVFTLGMARNDRTQNRQLADDSAAVLRRRGGTSYRRPDGGASNTSAGT